MKTFLPFLFLLFLALAITGCGKDDPATPLGCNSQAFGEALSNVIMRLGDASVLYANDQTTANCNAYKQASRDYINEIEQFADCAGFGDTEEYRNSLRDARFELDTIDCQ